MKGSDSAISAATRGTDVRDVAIAVALFLAAMAWLVFSVSIPPVADYPNHMARIFIESHLKNDVDLAKYYTLFWHFQPNLALDAVAYFLMPIFGMYVTGHILVIATFASVMLGSVALHRALHGRISFAAMTAVVFVVNRYFIEGFHGFLFSLGLMLAGLAIWVACRDRPLLRLFLGAIAAVVIYLGHLYAFGAYATGVLGYEMIQVFSAFSWRKLFSRGAVAFFHLWPAAFLFFLVSPTIVAINSVEWRPLKDKIAGPIVVFPGYDPLIEAAIVGVCFAVPLIAWRRGYLTLRKDFLAALVLFAILYLVMPDILLTSYGADRRLIIPMVFLAVLSVDWSAQTAGMRRLQWGLLAAAMFAQFVHLNAEWQSSEPMFADLVGLTKKVERGAKVAGATVIRTQQYMTFPPFHEVVGLFVMERSAFVPNLYVYPTDAASPIRYTPPYASRAFRSPVVYAPETNGMSDAQERLNDYLTRVERSGEDYLLLIDDERASLRLPANYLLIGETRNHRGRLFKINR